MRRTEGQGQGRDAKRHGRSSIVRKRYEELRGAARERSADRRLERDDRLAALVQRGEVQSTRADPARRDLAGGQRIEGAGGQRRLGLAHRLVDGRQQALLDLGDARGGPLDPRERLADLAGDVGDAGPLLDLALTLHRAREPGSRRGSS